MHLLTSSVLPSCLGGPPARTDRSCGGWWRPKPPEGPSLQLHCWPHGRPQPGDDDAWKETQ
eukprot:11499136-Alexandrium_andersonii.AAC.1